jgi:hypothetical protein
MMAGEKRSAVPLTNFQPLYALVSELKAGYSAEVIY